MSISRSDLLQQVNQTEVKLFASVDLAGSTSFKNKNRSWIDTFERFYKDFPVELLNAYGEHLPDGLSPSDFEISSRLHPAKFIGDEIVFEAELSQHQQVLPHAWALRQAVKSYNRQLQKNQPTKGLAAKAAIWVAAFPLVNKYVRLEIGSETVSDFIGPFIDAGFRLTRLATPRKVILSIDVALMIAHAAQKYSLEDQNFRLFFDGRHELHGIHRGIPYPIVWLDVLNEDSAEEKLLETENKKLKFKLLEDFLKSYMGDHKVHTIFFKDDPDPDFSPFENRGATVKPEIADQLKRFLSKTNPHQDSLEI